MHWTPDDLMNFNSLTLQEYLDCLASREPVPGGGSAAALSAALGAALISMVTRYSIGRKNNTKALDRQLNTILQKSEAIRRRLLELAGEDAQAYLNVVAARSKDAKAQRSAAVKAGAVPKEVCCLCYKAVELTPFLAAKGNPHLLSDVEAGVEFLMAGFNAAMVMVRANA